jgi:transposase
MTEGEKLADMAKRLNLTYVEAADMAGVHIATWYRWIAGDTRIPKSAYKLFEMMVRHKA